MTGLVVIGSSLRSFSKTLLKNYLSYFEDQGFQFSPLSVPDFQPFLKEKIEECELDYFLRRVTLTGMSEMCFVLIASTVF